MIRIMTDSTCDIPKERLEELGIETVPLSVHFGAEVFQDGVDITNKEFYDRLRQVETLPTTSQVNPEEFAARFQGHVEQGDQVVGIFLSSLLSGTCQSAAIARDMVDRKNIFVIDSGTVTFALGLLVERAAALRDAGLSPEELAAQIETEAKRVRLLAVVDTLKYLKMGGRISGAAAVVGGMLGITPILSVKDGVVAAVAKARGRKAAFSWMENQLKKEPVDLTMPVCFGHSDAPIPMEECKTFFLARLPGVSWNASDIGSVVGTHAGPGAAGIAYFMGEQG